MKGAPSAAAADRAAWHYFEEHFCEIAPDQRGGRGDAVCGDRSDPSLCGHHFANGCGTVLTGPEGLLLGCPMPYMIQ